MKHKHLLPLPLLLLIPAACGDDAQQTAVVTIDTSNFVGWDDGTTTSQGDQTIDVRVGTEIILDNQGSQLVVSVDDISETSVEFAFSTPMAAGTTGGGSDLISGITVGDGNTASFSSPSEDAVTIFEFSVEIGE